MCVTLAIQHSAAVLYGPKNLSLYPHANVTISVNWIKHSFLGYWNICTEIWNLPNKFDNSKTAKSNNAVKV